MAKLAGETVVAVDELSVDDDTAADACAEGDHDEVTESAGGAVGHLAEGSCVGVVGDGDGDAELLADHLREGKGHGPGEVYAVLDHTGVVVGVGRADAYAEHLADGVVGFEEAEHLGVKLVEISVEVCMLEGFD